MTDVVKICGLLGLSVPSPTTDARSRRVYRIAARSIDDIYAACRYLVDGGCHPRVKTCDYNKSTVEVIENRKTECWVFKYFARSEEHAETVAEELLVIVEPFREFQMELGI